MKTWFLAQGVQLGSASNRISVFQLSANGASAVKIVKIKPIHGPNVFHHKPVLIMTLDLEEYAEVHSANLPGFLERLTKFLPGLKEHTCSPGYVGGFIERLRRGTYMGHIIEHVALELSEPAGIGQRYGKTVRATEPNQYNVVVRFSSEEGMTYLLQKAVDLVQAAIDGKEFDVDHVISRAKVIIQDGELGPSTKAIVDAAERRNIPWLRLNENNLIQFGYGKQKRLIQATTTNLTSDIAVDIAQDKELTKRILSQGLIPVPKGVLVHTLKEAIDALDDLSVPVAVKPLDGHQGKGVSLNIRTPEQMTEAFEFASRYSRTVLVEEQFVGKDYRILVVNGKMIAAAERIPAHVVGDGTRTVAELIEIENRNPHRGEGHEKQMTKISIDEIAKAYLKKAQLSLESIPENGKKVFLRETANLSTGGIASDVTDDVHPEIKATCERAARIIGLDICGIDLIVPDIRKPMFTQRAGIIEVNAGPGIRMHHFPSHGKSRDVGSAIVESMYPNGQDGRIPLIAITGTNGKTTVTRMIGHILNNSGKTVGMTTTDGIFIGGVRTAVGDTTGPVSARSVLCDPAVETAVLETARGGIIKRGLAYDWSDVAIITNIQPDHIGQDGIENVEDILRIKSLVAERVRENGTVILNADDELLVKLSEKLEKQNLNRKTVYFSLHYDNVTIRRHIAAGGSAFYLKPDGWIYENTEGKEFAIAKTSDFSITFNGTALFHVANILSAVAACRTQGLSREKIIHALKTFDSIRDNEGRTNVYKVGKGYVMVDYGHNPDAFRAICEMTSKWHGYTITGIIGVPGDRSDEVAIEAAKIATRGFDRIIIREDINLRGRKKGEIAELLQRTVREAAPDVPCFIELDERVAITKALKDVDEKEIIVVFFDELDVIQKHLKTFDAKQLYSLAELDFAIAEEYLEVG